MDNRFEKLNLSPEILRAVADMGFEEATVIQSQSIPLVMEGRDVIGHSQTGTGKTAAFGIPAIEKTDKNNPAVQTLVLCPTRELAVQASEELRRYAKYKPGIRILPIYGGQPIERQIREMKKGVHIVIGTPGRVMDHMRRHTLRTDQVSLVVLDEADEMLDMGFRDDVETILKDTPADRQTILFSATMSQEILELTRRYQRNPELIKVVHKQLTVPLIEQYYFEVPPSKKEKALSRLIDMYNPKLSLVFCNTKRKVDEVAGGLQAMGYSADALHGDMSQPSRDRVMGAFRSGTVDVLVATDVAARGIDVEDIEAVFNFDVPQDEEYYVHRIGRTGRAGRAGRAFTFVSGRREIYALKDIQRYTSAEITRQQIPTLSDVEESRSYVIQAQIKEILGEGNLERYTGIVDTLLEDDYTSVDIASALLKMVLGREMEGRQPDEDEFGGGTTGGEAGMARLFMNVGRRDGVRPGDIVGAIAGETGIHGKLIGTIDVYDKYTFVEVPQEYARDVLTAMKDAKIKGRKANMQPARAKASGHR